MKQIEIKGDIVSSGNEWLYEWYGIKAVSPEQISKALEKANNEPVKIIINSGGGAVYAGYEIYNTLKNYKGGVEIEIHGLAASIASVIAMAGKCKMSPLSQMMIHNVSCGVNGDYRVMEHYTEVLKKANKTISSAYSLKSGKGENEFLRLMDKETWFTANEALELGLVDEIMYSNGVKSTSSYSSDGDSINLEEEKSKLQAQINLLKLKSKITRNDMERN